MATWTRFYINSDDLEKVTIELMRLLEVNNLIKGNFPDDFYDSFLLDDKSTPNYVVFTKTQAKWVTVLYNCANKLEDCSKEISKNLDCNVIVTIGQNTVDYYYFSQYYKGIKKREIEVCYGDDIEEINYGEPYDFEGVKPGEAIEEENEIDYVFDIDSLEKYSKYFGIDFQFQWSNNMWYILKGNENQKTAKEYAEELLMNKKTPWWKFW